MTGAVPATMTGAQTLNPAATLPPDAVVVGKRKLQAVYALAAVATLAFLGVAETARDLRYVELQDDGQVSEPVTFLGTPYTEANPKLSPDGRFVAYVSNESGRWEVYVRPFPDGPGKWQASVNGGTQVRWSRDGAELYYAEGTSLMAVSVSAGSGFTLGQPRELFESHGLGLVGPAPYDVSLDGQRFLAIEPVEGSGAAPPTIRVVLNWYEEFRDRER